MCTVWQRFQHLYLGALYGVLAMKSVFMDDFATLAGGSIGPVAVARMTRAEAALFWAGKALFFSAFLGAPALVGAHSWAALAALWLGSEAVAGWVLALMFQVGTPCHLFSRWNTVLGGQGAVCFGGPRRAGGRGRPLLGRVGRAVASLSARRAPGAGAYSADV